ncbi:hypothetical protein SASPL_142891 [Salvia splendens]|uniref:Uncharacterized protein n=2 Tax=Salvia splendens TaxID=180675 RepID=A0A8X8ZAA4_SALSN|nr:uncharacterized protein LOC121769749 isoform X1 [Salvia splendens]XP_042022434.1 uncharacterized protein LOC121769749 isoform X1 [Salvia splendens]KAG6396734.1 hypothetical protein SASPL_142891 [Salvia splendens]
MTPEGSLKPSKKALNGVHGVHLLPHSPFTVQEIKQHGELNRSACGTSSLRRSKQPVPLKLWQERPAFLRPIHCCTNVDRSFAERVVNVLTSLPFVALGIQAPRRNLSCTIYGNSLIGVGVASSLYHVSRGTWRKYLRWADRMMIATSTLCLTRALRNDNSKLLMATSALVLPIQPLMVTTVHTGLMEVAFAKRAVEDPDLRVAHNVHKMSSIIGGALFICEDYFPETPYLHAAWHLAAAVGVGTCNKLLE